MEMSTAGMSARVSPVNVGRMRYDGGGGGDIIRFA